MGLKDEAAGRGGEGRGEGKRGEERWGEVVRGGEEKRRISVC